MDAKHTPEIQELLKICKKVLRDYASASNGQQFAKRFGEIEPKLREAVEKATQ